MSIKKDFIIGLQNYQLVCTTNPALMGQISYACRLVVLKSNDEYFFHPNFVFTWVKTLINALLTLFHFVRVRAAHQPHVMYVVVQG